MKGTRLMTGLLRLVAQAQAPRPSVPDFQMSLPRLWIRA